MNQCMNCDNHSICKIAEQVKALQGKYYGISIIEVNLCTKHHQEKVIPRPGTKVNSSRTLDKLGLGEDSAPEEKNIESNVVTDGQFCPSCEMLKEKRMFLGDKCSKCGEEVCADCAIESEDGTVCEKCF